MLVVVFLSLLLGSSLGLFALSFGYTVRSRAWWRLIVEGGLGILVFSIFLSLHILGIR